MGTPLTRPCWPALGCLVAGLVLGIAAVGIGAAVIAHGRRRRSEAAAVSIARFLFLLAWLSGGLALYYVAVLDRNAFNVRYSSFVTPALYALFGIGLAAFAHGGDRRCVAWRGSAG